MRILRLVPSISVKCGGPQNGIYSLTPLLTKKGIKTSILTLDYDRDDFQIFDEIYKFNSITDYKFNFKALVSVFFLKKEIKSFNLLIIHGHWQFHVLLGFLIHLRYKIPYVIYPHGMLDPYFMRKNSLRSFLKYIIWFLYEKSVLKNSQFICFTSKKEQTKSFQIFNSKNNNNIVVPYGLAINSEEYLEGLDRYNKDSLNIIYLGRFSPKKNLTSIINALEISKRENLKINIIMVGLDSSPYSKNIEFLVNKFGLNDQIKLIKYIKNDEKYIYLSKADFSIVSSFQENFCISAIESLSLGVPVIISSNCDISHHLDESGSAIVSGTSNKSIYKALKKAYLIKKNKYDFKKMKKNAKETFKKFYSLENSSENIIKIFKEAMEI